MHSEIPYEKMLSMKILHEKRHYDHTALKIYRWCLMSTCLAALLLSVMYLQTLLLRLSVTESKVHTQNTVHGDTCPDPCSIVLIESIPEGLEFNSTANPSIYQSWLNLIGEAKSSLDIASFYWTLTNEDTGTQEPTAYQGEQILKELTKLSKKESSVSVRIAVNTPQGSMSDLNILMQAGADVRTVNMRKLTTGVLHTKFWVVDNRHIYLGSANMDWRSLTQVKELGVVVYNCSCLANDLKKVFEAYWYLGKAEEGIPAHWPHNYSTSYNEAAPLELTLNNTLSTAYLSSSPPSLCADGRTQDLDAILSVIENAQEFVYIAVMNYLPIMEYSHSRRYWSEIDSQLRRVAYERRVCVRLLISCWARSSPVMFPFLRSLAALHDKKSKVDIQVKLFVVPSSPSQKAIPFARVNHNKYMVTDKVAYIGTSNWSGDYFVNTAGTALVVNQTAGQSTETTIQEQLKDVFLRDWYSPYSTLVNQHTNTKQLCNAQHPHS